MRKKRDLGSVVSAIIFPILFVLPTIWLFYLAMQHPTYRRDCVIVLLAAACMYGLGFTKGMKSRDKEVIRLAKEADELEQTIRQLNEKKSE